MVKYELIYKNNWKLRLRSSLFTRFTSINIIPIPTEIEVKMELESKQMLQISATLPKSFLKNANILTATGKILRHNMNC